MKGLRTSVLLFVLVGVLFAGTSAQSVSESKNPVGQKLRFPAVESENLERRTVKLPHDFSGERNLVLIAFQREQQKDLDTWLQQMKQFAAVDSALRCYELPVIARLNSITRWFISNGMRSGMASQEQRERTIILYLDKAPFRAALGLGDEKKVYALLLDREGNVLWRAEGRFDEAKASSLRQTLERFTRAH